METYGLPLNSRKLFTKDDWMTFLAATYYTTDAVPQPSAFSSMLFDGLYRFANETTSREVHPGTMHDELGERKIMIK
jgi:hypothetical protein